MTLLSALARAYDRLPDAPPVGYSAEKIGFVIGLRDDGSVASVVDLRDAEGKRKVPRVMKVPASFKRPGTSPRPFLFWDNTAFALGVTTTEGKDAGQRWTAFREFHLDLLRDADDPGLVAFRRFLQSWSPSQFVPPQWPDEMKDQNVVFALESERLDGTFLHDRPAARALVTRRGSGDTPENAPRCLVTGEKASPARLHPAIKNVWGAQSSGASIVSFNLDAFESYGHKQGDNAPVSELTAFKYTTALNAFLAGRRNRVQIGDTSTVFWAEAADTGIAQLAESIFDASFSDIDLASEDQKVGAVLERIRKGIAWEQALGEVMPGLSPGVRFHILGLAPNAARLSIRFWLEDDFGRLVRNYQRFMEDMAIAPPPRELYPPLWRYLVETAVQRKRENVAPNLGGEWTRAILAGTRYPLTLLSSIITRIRADGELNAYRAAMLRAVLVRNFDMVPNSGRDRTREAPVALDPGNRNKGYLLGRLFAVYEYVQTAALGRNVNATIKDKYYGAASATPRKVFALLDKGSANHLSKVGKQRRGQRIFLEQKIGEILEIMSPDGDPFPAALPSEDQALFGLGYYHQRSAFFARTDDGIRTEGETSQ